MICLRPLGIVREPDFFAQNEDIETVKTQKFIHFFIFCFLTFVPFAALANGGTSSLIIKLVDGLSPAEQAAVIARNGGVEKSSVPALRMHVVDVPTAQLDAIRHSYESDPQVVRVEVNQTRQAEATPSDPFYSSRMGASKDWVEFSFRCDQPPQFSHCRPS